MLDRRWQALLRVGYWCAVPLVLPCAVFGICREVDFTSIFLFHALYVVEVWRAGVQLF